MRIPMSLINKNVIVKTPEKGNSLSAGIDFYVPEKGTILEFNPGFKDNEYIYLNKSIDIVMKDIVYIENPVYIRPADIKKSCVERSTLEVNEDGSSSYVYYLYPGENVKIHSGISIEIDFGQCALVCNRSGIASKECAVVGAELIDCGYANELIFDIHNIGLKPIVIKPGMKITQLLIQQYISCTPIMVDKSNMYEDLSKFEFRGNKGFGSSDNK